MNLTKKIILLTSTIDVNNCANTNRTSISDRKQDYYDTLKLWLTNTPCDFNFVFIENSGYDLSYMYELDENNRVEFISIDDNNYNREFGKGHGEFREIKYAVQKSFLLSTYDYLIKVTGHYYLSTLPEHLIKFDTDKYEALLYSTNNNFDDRFQNSMFFLITMDRYHSHMKHLEVNEIEDKCFEYMLYDTCADIDRTKIYPIDYMGLNGYSGTHNTYIQGTI